MSENYNFIKCILFFVYKCIVALRGGYGDGGIFSQKKGHNITPFYEKTKCPHYEWVASEGDFGIRDKFRTPSGQMAVSYCTPVGLSGFGSGQIQDISGQMAFMRGFE